MIKKVNYTVKGMSKDLAASKFNPDYAYDIRNMRIVATEDEGGYALTNELGTKEIDIPIGNEDRIHYPIGQTVIDNKLIVFSTDNDGDDLIEAFTLDGDTLTKDAIYEGYNLGFSTDYPIECVSIYENSEIVKVYWTDNKNQPRVININASSQVLRPQFLDFVNTITLDERVSITRNSDVSGVFSAGTIQYCFTYYNKYGSESNVFYSSPLYYTSSSNKGTDGNTTVSNSFSITITNPDASFDYIRIYSIQRTSPNGTPIVKRVADIALTVYSTTSVSFTDTGTTGEIIDPTELLYKGGEVIKAGTMAQKDNTLFLGDITVVRKYVPDAIKNAFKNGTISFYQSLRFTDNGASGYYFYKNQLDKNSATIKSFKYLETYRFGVQFQDDTGKWSSPVWINDAANNIAPSVIQSAGTSYTYLANATFTVSSALLTQLRYAGYRRMRPVVVYPNANEREVICQGVLCPTVYNVKDRAENGPFVQASWFTRPNAPTQIYDTIQYSAASYALNETDTIVSMASALPLKRYKITVDTASYSTLLSELQAALGDHPQIYVYNTNTDDYVWFTVDEVDEENGYIFVFSSINGYEWSDYEPNTEEYAFGWRSQEDIEYITWVREDGSSSSGSTPDIPTDGYYLYHVKVNSLVGAANTQYLQVGNYGTFSEIGAPFRVSSVNKSSNPWIVTVFNYTSPENGYPITLPSSGVMNFTVDGVDHGVSYNGYSTSEGTTVNPDPGTGEENGGDPGSGSGGTTGGGTTDGGNTNPNTPLPPADDTTSPTYNASDLGNYAEFRHNKPIPSSIKDNAEIACIFEPPADAAIPASTSTTGWIAENSEYYFVDQSVVTMHSPDIEFDKALRNIDGSGLKLRIIGMVPIHASYSTMDIQTSTPPSNFILSFIDGVPQYGTETALGFYKQDIGYNAYNTNAYKSMLSGFFWMDEIFTTNTDYTNLFNYLRGFTVYPWQRSGALNNLKVANSLGIKTSVLSKKKMSVMRFSASTNYLSTPWNAYIAGSSYRTGISGVAILDGDTQTAVGLPEPLNSPHLGAINYYSNVDKLLTTSNVGNYSGDYGSKSNGYPIVASSNRSTDPSVVFAGGKWTSPDTEWRSKEPVSIKYKSTAHAVMALNYTTTGWQRVLPHARAINGADLNSTFFNYGSSYVPFWKNVYYSGVYQDLIDVVPEYGFLWLGELYNDRVENKFGGTTDEAIANNQWLPAGPIVNLYSGSQPVTSATLTWDEGDTYFQRYDCLKTYAYTNEDTNSIVDIVSFMCETRTNIDGRYDSNRGKLNNTYMSPVNFNLLNTAYTQDNNFFSYRDSDLTKLKINRYPNLVTWSKPKTNGEEIDSWTNITLASTLDLDGDKGTVRAIRRYNNDLIAFQDTGISNILYNENIQIASTTGVPIEIANSGRVQGKRYITDKIGCTNKWSICDTPNGLYFIDNTTKDLYSLNSSGINNISDTLGFHTWMTQNINGTDIWKPDFSQGCVLYYDKKNSEVLIINKDECLAYNENLGRFTSFYSYEGTPYFTYIRDRGIMLHRKGTEYYYPWLFREGDYNTFFRHHKPFSITVVANPEPTEDKVFNNVEFRADSWNSDGTLLGGTFDTIRAWNEYQDTHDVSLVSTKDTPSILKKKFRVWRANIPRKFNSRDRIRNTWSKIKLEMKNSNTNKTVLHDISVDYLV